MFFIDLSIVPIFVIWAGAILYLNIRGFMKKKSLFHGINLGISLLLLLIHMSIRAMLPAWKFNVSCDLVFLAISISLFLYVNDIETRRKVISEVFESRYKKEKDKK